MITTKPFRKFNILPSHNFPDDFYEKMKIIIFGTPKTNIKI